MKKTAIASAVSKHFGPSRADLMERKDARGHGKANLWYLYLPKIGMDVALSSDAEYLNAISMDGDPDVEHFTINPPPFLVPVGSDVHQTEFDAFVKRKSGRPELREVKAIDLQREKETTRDEHQREAQILAIERLGYDYLRVGVKELLAQQQFLSNWRRARAFLDAARLHPLDQFKIAAIAAANRRKQNTLRELAEGVPAGDLPVFFAACFSLAQHGQLATDLSSKPLSMATKFWIGGKDYD